ncbi:unnamed protein product (mitochondrion) [Plasmodiophora brassicae]|uniref:Ubiquinone biosynthesis O-methyltransferase, mitochondrial n=2 Tax=Plasmodiophora brassicae TaxID=37360 RepID=A0A3P3Y9P6_PLABS|nr:unnamed protein product [Plasmodiophora brassicae]
MLSAAAPRPVSQSWRRLLQRSRHVCDATVTGGYDRYEIAKFAKMADDWWKPNGPMEMLHLMNPVRIGYIASRLGVDLKSNAFPFSGLRILDVGCGAGILTESLARLGATVVGVDRCAEAVMAAKIHAKRDPLFTSQNLAYFDGGVEEVVGFCEGLAWEAFDVVTCLEVIEHFPNAKCRDGFVKNVASVVKPGGSLFLSTINRTAKAYALAIVGAEYLLRWVKPGTHDFNKFVMPNELADMVRKVGLDPVHQTGAVLDPVRRHWSLSESDLDINYMMHCRKPTMSSPWDKGAPTAGV